MKRIALTVFTIICATSAFANSVCTLSINGREVKTEQGLNVKSENGDVVIMEAGAYRLKITSVSGENNSGKSIWVAILDADGSELTSHLTVAVGGARFASSQLQVKAPNGDRVGSLCYVSDN